MKWLLEKSRVHHNSFIWKQLKDGRWQMAGRLGRYKDKVIFFSDVSAMKVVNPRNITLTEDSDFEELEDIDVFALVL